MIQMLVLAAERDDLAVEIEVRRASAVGLDGKFTISAVGFGTEWRTARSSAAQHLLVRGGRAWLRTEAPAMMKPNWWIG